MIWNEWALHLLYKELDEDIKKLEEIANGSNAENEDEEIEEK